MACTIPAMQRLILAVLVLALCCSMSSRVHAQSINFKVQEEQNPPVRLGNIAQEAGIGLRPDLEFSIISKVNYEPDLFALETSTGEFRTAARLDRESLCGSVSQCVLSTLVAASSAPDFFTRFSVNVTVQDANDQSPVFKQDVFPMSISERVPVNSTFLLPVAFDADARPAYRVKGYRLLPATQTTFDLVQTSGNSEPEVHLRLRQALDRELKADHVLTMVAFDGGSPANEAELSIQVSVLDDNDNAPVFSSSSYRWEVTEVHPLATPIARVSAEDKDSGDNARIGYELSTDVTPRIRDLFAVQEDTGEITLTKSLDQEGGNVLRFKVTAFDHGSPSKSSEAEVVIEVEDTVNDPPSIHLSPWKSRDGSAVVSEAATVGTKVAFVDVKDSDSESDQVGCEVESAYFDMQPYKTPGVYTIAVSRSLDRERQGTHTVTIRCSDQGDPPMTSTATLSITVDDANDNLPVFSTDVYRMSVKENQEAGRKIGAVSATDRDPGVNGELRYSLDGTVTEFVIDEVTGYIRTAVNSLDRETTSSYTFEVYAADIGPSSTTASATVLVIIEDVNDEWPRFDNASYKFSVSEKMAVHRIVGVVHASDKDLGAGGTVKYLMVPSPSQPNTPFTVNQQDGSIVLTGSLDYETAKRYSFMVTAVDLGRPPRNTSIRVDIDVLDENDNSPVIEFPSPDNLSVTLNLDISPGHEVVKVSAHDPDSGENGRLSFSIVSPNTSSSSALFWINEDTGLITLLSPLTEKDVRSYNVIISVRDNGVMQRATQAILEVDVVRSADGSGDSHTNMTIVIIMVCVTLSVAVVVLATLCFIKYSDRRHFHAHKHHAKSDMMHQHAPKGTTYSDASLDRRADIFSDAVMENSPSLQQKQPLASSSLSSIHKPARGLAPASSSSTLPPGKSGGKKCVTFGDEDSWPHPIRNSPSSEWGGSSNNTHNDSVFLESGVSTFKPDSCPSPYTVQHPVPSGPPSAGPKLLLAGDVPGRTSSPRPVIQGQSQSQSLQCQGPDGDQVVDFALQHHNALVQSMRGNSRRPGHSRRQQQGGVVVRGGTSPSSSPRDTTDVCSSSSVETSDSGHGSELDVSVAKACV